MEENISVRSVGIKYGAISGVIGILSTVLQDVLSMQQDTIFQVLGIAIFIVLLVLAYREYKTQGDGFMEYGQGVGIGFWFGLISSAISSVFLFIYIKFISTSFIDIIREKQIVGMEEQGMSDAQIEQAMKMSEAFTGPAAMMIFGMIGGILISVIAALIISAFMKNARPEFE
ncbi:MAG: hypothetical protein ACI8QD_002420 [Cyclobacteriaceae bacterium]|jgi:hypothetical protein